VYSDKTGTGQTVINLVELADGTIAGTFTSTAGGAGSIDGRAEGQTLNMLLRQVGDDCSGQFSISVTISGDTASGTYTGFDCHGDRGEGVIAMARSQNSSSPGTPQSTGTEQPTFEYGEPSELAKIQSVFVFTENDNEAKQTIANEIRASRLLQVVDDPSRADATIYFVSEKVNLGYGSHTVTQGHRNPSYPTYQNTYSIPITGMAGAGSVFRIPEPGKIRILWEFESTSRKYRKSPEKKFVKNFLKVLREAQTVNR
jgi:hypothetical protein